MLEAPHRSGEELIARPRRDPAGETLVLRRGRRYALSHDQISPAKFPSVLRITRAVGGLVDHRAAPLKLVALLGRARQGPGPNLRGCHAGVADVDSAERPR